MNISTLQNDNITRFGEFEAVNFEGKWRTNLQNLQDANRLGYLLRDLGVEKGDRVVLQLLNCPEVLVGFPAISRIGAVIVPLSPLLGPDQATYILRDCGAKVIITSSHFLEGARKVKERVPDLKHIVLIDRDDLPDTIPYQKKMQEYSTELEVVHTENDDVAALIYTAGTTGKPKGVMHTHFSLYVNALFLYEYTLVNRPKTIAQTVTEIDPKTNQPVITTITVTGLERSVVSLVVLPLSHAYGIALMNMGALLGGQSIVHPWFDATKALEAIQTYKIKYMALVPTMYIHLLNHPNFDDYDLSSILGCSCGSAPLPLEVARKWEDKVGVEIREGWGMSETGATTCGQPPKQPPKYGSIGKSIFRCNTVKIVNEQDQETATYEKGEIVVKGPTLMKGYWNKPEETAEAMRNGWLYSGDIGYRDEDGYIYITDRKKDIIIRGGENVSPREVEEVLFQHPNIVEAGVIGIKDEVYGEEIKAFIVLREKQQFEEDEMTAFCRERLPKFKTPKKFQMVDELPKNPVGKILRSELRKLG